MKGLLKIVRKLYVHNIFKIMGIEGMTETDFFVDKLYSEIIKILSTGPKTLRSNWEVGRILTKIDELQAGAAYKALILKKLAIKLNSTLKKGYGEINLKSMKTFYKNFLDFEEVCPQLTWTHYYILGRIGNEFKRKKLLLECIENNRNSRWLRNQLKFNTDSAVDSPTSTLIQIFLKVNQTFLSKEVDSIILNLSERSLCAQMMMYLRHELDISIFREYHVDVEYNRNDSKIKTIIDNDMKVIAITCDLIVHSRGQIIAQDNLLAVEMKKSTAKKEEKDKDRNRLIALTKDSYDDVWSFDGVTLPEHVCGYLLGVYYEINVPSRSVLLEFYRKGKLDFEQKVAF